MNRKGHYEQQYNEIWDVVVKNALIDHSNTYFSQVPPEEEIKRSHDFSPEFQKRMEQLLEQKQTDRQTELSPKEDEEFMQLDQSFWEEWKRTAGNTTKQQPETSVVEPGPASIPACPDTMRENPIGETPDTQLTGNICSDKKENKKKKWRIRGPVRVAAAVILIVGIVGAGVMQFEPIRATIMQTVVNFDKQGVLISNTNEDDYHILFREPTFIPQGYKLISNFEDEITKSLEYSNGQNDLNIIISLYDEDSEAAFDNERHFQNQESILIKNRYTATFFTPDYGNNLKILSWHNGIIQYDIFGCESKKLLIKIAESMMK